MVFCGILWTSIVPQLISPSLVYLEVGRNKIPNLAVGIFQKPPAPACHDECDDSEPATRDGEFSHTVVVSVERATQPKGSKNMQLTKHQCFFCESQTIRQKLNTAFLLARIAIQGAYKWKSYLMEPDNYSRNTKTSHSHRIRSLSQSPILLGQNLWFHLRWWNIMKYLNILWYSLNHSKGVHLIVSNNLIPFPWGPAVQIFFEPTWPWWWRSFWRYDIGAAIARLKPPFWARKSSEGWIKRYAQNNTQRIEKQ